MVAMLWTVPHARSVVEPQTSTLGLLLGHSQAFLPPDPLNAFVVDPPALMVKKRRDAPVPIAAELARKFHDPCHQRLLIIPNLPKVSLRRTVLTKHLTSSSLTRAQLVACVINSTSSPSWA